MKNTGCQVLFPNGNTSIKNHDRSWTSINNDGVKLTTSTQEPPKIESIKVVREKDPVTGRTVITREDMVNITQDDHGNVIIQQADGTTVVATVISGSGILGPKDVEEAHITGARYAAVTVNKKEYRSSVELPNGTVIERRYSEGISKTLFHIMKVMLFCRLEGTLTGIMV